jgi:ABC-2 type transport system ATP-binding protein
MEKTYNNDAAVAATNLTKIFRDFWRRPKKLAVDDVSFSIRRGEVFGLLGPNGSGKSTTIKMLLGLLRPTSGNVSLFGMSPEKRQVREKVGYMPELSHFHLYLTPRETLRYYAGLFNIPARDAEEKIAYLLDKTNMTEAGDRPLGEFSKGMARRVGLAQALLNDPELIILDEPTSGLDPIGRHDVKELIKELAAADKTVLLSSHLLAEVEDVCDRVVILCDGHIGAEGSLSELLEKRDLVRMTADTAYEEQITYVKHDIEKDGGKVLLDRPAMTLEEYFLEIVKQEQKSESSK